MHKIMSLNEYARMFYETDEPTRGQLNAVSRKCREGTIRNARKMGHKWFIDCTAEWPELFPEAEPPEKEQPAQAAKPMFTPDMTLGEALAVLLDALAGKEVANVHR